jgi:hypothetical protein
MEYLQLHDEIRNKITQNQGLVIILTSSQITKSSRANFSEP